MSVVVSLLRAIDRADGEALVMHVGEKPYVVTATGHAELAASALTVPAMTGMLEQLLPPDSRQALNELGAVEYHLPSDEAAPGTRYSVVAARGGDDIWIEVRRRKQPDEPAPAALEQPHRAVPPSSLREATPAEEAPSDFYEDRYTAPPETAERPVFEAAEPMGVEDSAAAPFTGSAELSVADAPAPIPFDEPEPPPFEYPERIRAEEPAPAVAPEPAPAPMFEPPPDDDAPTFAGAPPVDDPRTFAEAPAAYDGRTFAEAPPADDARMFADAPPALDARPFTDAAPADDSSTSGDAPAPASAHDEHRYVVRDVADRFELRLQAEGDFYGSTAVEEDLEAEVRHVDESAPALDFTIEPEPPPAPLREPIPPHRVSLQYDSTPRPAASGPAPERRATAPAATHADPLHRLLKTAAVQGASAVYVAAQSRPSLRVDGEMRVLDDPPMPAGDLEAAFRALIGIDLDDAALPLGEFETRELHGVGRVQCLLFRDHRGLGAIFRMLPGRTVSAQKAGLSAGIQSICTEPEGLLVVAGSHGSGKSTLVAALVDQINRTRRDHVITVESDIQFVHENQSSFISQREAREEDRFLEAVRSAIREAPDVLVIDGVMNAEVASTALEAAAYGLVVVSLAAPSTVAALESFIGLVGRDRPEVRALVSEHLRGVVTQALLRKTGGGRAAAREVLVNVPAVAALVANAQLGDLASVLNAGRRLGMVPLNDALLELVQSGALDVRQAYRKSPDPAEFVSMLSKAGFDTTFAESLA